MNSSLFESFEGGCLGVGKPGFDAAFGENPASFAGINQQEFHRISAHPVTNRGHPFTFPQLAQFRQPNEFSR
jgi:hypothetical protein